MLLRYRQTPDGFQGRRYDRFTQLAWLPLVTAIKLVGPDSLTNFQIHILTRNFGLCAARP